MKKIVIAGGSRAQSCAHSSTSPRFLVGRASGKNRKLKIQDSKERPRPKGSDE
jgi:hypothetical protein